ncbi:MAG: alanine--tRNA ligase, partial [Alphaproteobacteria bacterium]
RMLGFEDPVLYKTAGFVLDFMAEAYPDEAARKDFVTRVVQNEEERFILTLGNGLRILQEEVAALRQSGTRVIPGETVFKLYDTYGFPVDLTADIVEKEGFTLDEEGFEACMERQRAQAREHWKGDAEAAAALVYKRLAESGSKTEFTGYQTLTDEGTVLALLRQGEEVAEAACGETVELIADRTPCYGESGGQVGDTGVIRAAEGELRLLDTRKPAEGLIVHVCEVVTGAVKKGDRVRFEVDAGRRAAIVRNHTATHLLQAALQKILGDHVKQAGSLVEPDRLRFDFTHFSPLTAEEIRRIEDEVNSRILDNLEVGIRMMSADEAKAAGAMALFGEKYGDIVRVVNVGDYSLELCGGTHAKASGDIGLFRIVSEGGIAAGVRRIEAVTGTGALDWVRNQEQTLARAASLVKSDPQNLETRLRKLMEQQKELERQVEKLQAQLQAGQSDQMLQQA